MPFRTTYGIVSDTPFSDPAVEADLIIVAVALGYAALSIEQGVPVQFDMDPLDVEKDAEKTAAFRVAVDKLDQVILADFERRGALPQGSVRSGSSPGYFTGAVIVGVYRLAGHPEPLVLIPPDLTPKGQALYESIRDLQVPQYLGFGAYTGFVDNPNTDGNTDPVGPRSTARFLAPTPEALPNVHPRWLPRPDSSLWIRRTRRDQAHSRVPWGILNGDAATLDPTQPNRSNAPNLSDQTIVEMRDIYGMVYVGEPTLNDIVNYTHGMIQAIYKAYALGPTCVPYEIAVGAKTTKMASCLHCSVFMAAAGYPATSTHLGSGDSWAPLYTPYNPGGAELEPHEAEVLRDLNGAWYAKCAEFLKRGLEILNDQNVANSHAPSLPFLRQYIVNHAADPTVAATLWLDASSLHDSYFKRINRTLRPPPRDA